MFDRFVVVGFVLACLVAPASGADEGRDYSRSGLYLGLGASLIVPLFEDEVEDWAGVSADVDYSVGLNLSIGMRFLELLAAELQYEGVKGYDVSAGGSQLFRMDSHSMVANAKLYWPLGRFQPYALAGIGFIHWDIHKNSNFELAGGSTFALAGRVGAGLDVYLTESLVLNTELNALLSDAEIATPSEPIDSIGYLSLRLGMLYRF